MLIAYSAGFSEDRTKYPWSLAAVVHGRPVSTWTAVILAPGRIAPEGSVTVPTMLPNPCAREEMQSHNRLKRSKPNFFMPPPWSDHARRPHMTAGGSDELADAPEPHAP